MGVLGQRVFRLRTLLRIPDRAAGAASGAEPLHPMMHPIDAIWGCRGSERQKDRLRLEVFDLIH